MIPLRLGQGGSFFVGHEGNFKTRWLCTNPKCIERVLKKPGQLRHQKDSPPPSREIIQQELSKYFVKRARFTLVDAQKSGVIVHGSQQVRNCTEQNLSAIVFSSDAGTQTRAQIAEIYNAVERLVFPDTSAEIGRLLRRGPRSVLALHHSRKTQSLIDTLRVGCCLG